jgi:hypothetical protein
MTSSDPRSAEEIAVPDDVSVEMVIEGLADAATGHTPNERDGEVEPDQPDQPAPPKDTPHPG